jgi:hypothetical protein
MLSQQLREAFPYDSAPQFLILDREHTFEGEVMQTAGSLGIRPVRTAVRSPWQNGIAERWVGSCRRELLDNVIVLNRRHLKRLMMDYIRYYHDDRTHLGLGKNTPTGRESAQRAPVNAEIISMPRLGGLHHRYDLAASSSFEDSAAGPKIKHYPFCTRIEFWRRTGENQRQTWDHFARVDFKSSIQTQLFD